MCGNDGMWHHGYGSWGWGWGSWIMTAIVFTLFFALVITAIVAAVRYLSGPRHGGAHYGPPPRRNADDILAERFARGEIDDEEYRRRVALLREHR